MEMSEAPPASSSASSASERKGRGYLSAKESTIAGRLSSAGFYLYFAERRAEWQVCEPLLEATCAWIQHISQDVEMESPAKSQELASNLNSAPNTTAAAPSAAAAVESEPSVDERIWRKGVGYAGTTTEGEDRLKSMRAAREAMQRLKPKSNELLQSMIAQLLSAPDEALSASNEVLLRALLLPPARAMIQESHSLDVGDEDPEALADDAPIQTMLKFLAELAAFPVFSPLFFCELSGDPSPLPANSEPPAASSSFAESPTSLPKGCLMRALCLFSDALCSMQYLNEAHISRIKALSEVVCNEIRDVAIVAAEHHVLTAPIARSLSESLQANRAHDVSVKLAQKREKLAALLKRALTLTLSAADSAAGHSATSSSSSGESATSTSSSGESATSTSSSGESATLFSSSGESATSSSSAGESATSSSSSGESATSSSSSGESATSSCSGESAPSSSTCNEELSRIYKTIMSSFQLSTAKLGPMMRLERGTLPSGALGAQGLRRISKEIHTIHKGHLPVEWQSSAILARDLTNPQRYRFMITGPDDTPYANGVFVFDMFLPPTYPQVPPIVYLMNTGGGTIRFGPNLYDSGKVCLSLLGTWSGPSWDPQVSSLYQIVVSIQSLILVANPYYHEPGYENTVNDEAANQYNALIRRHCVTGAMLDLLRHPPAGLKAPIRQHFVMKRAELERQFTAWKALNPTYVFAQSCDEVMAEITKLTDSPLTLFADENDAIDFQALQKHSKEVLEMDPAALDPMSLQESEPLFEALLATGATYEYARLEARIANEEYHELRRENIHSRTGIMRIIQAGSSRSTMEEET